ncbi:hypothetical protein [Microseira sp. BLCC-F43]|jgi:hypothetical protein|uniref:hypothetical protein n=1 Tax=Microseira sp. BLCC-F43 TaxID=3153602 RepID=UPI0035BACA14
MPVATNIEIINDTWNADKFRATLASKLLSIGYAQEAASGNEAVFRINAPNSSTVKPRAFLRTVVEQSGNSIKFQAWMGDGASQLTLTPNAVPLFAAQTFNNALFINYNSDENFSIKWITFSSSEVALVCGCRPDNNTSLFSVGFLFPIVKPAWWPATALYAFGASNRDIPHFRLLPGNPFSPNYVDLSFHLANQPSGFNPGGRPDVNRRIILCSSVGSGFVGLTSTDFGTIAASGLPQLSLNSDSGQNWVNIRGGSWSFAIRVA